MTDHLLALDQDSFSAREALAQARILAKDIAALGITNQSETTVMWNRRTGVPIHNAIV